MKDTNINRDEVTPPAVYFNRRQWMRASAAVGSVAATAGLYRWFNPVAKMSAQTAPIEALSVATNNNSSQLSQLNDQLEPRITQI